MWIIFCFNLDHLNRLFGNVVLVSTVAGDLAFFGALEPPSTVLGALFPPSDFFRSAALVGCVGARSLFMVHSVFLMEASPSVAFLFLSTNILWNLISMVSNSLSVCSLFVFDRPKIEACSPLELVG